jgi:hypothetical protein
MWPAVTKRIRLHPKKIRNFVGEKNGKCSKLSEMARKMIDIEETLLVLYLCFVINFWQVNFSDINFL